MQDIQQHDQVSAGRGESNGVIYFASQVVSLLADRSAKTVSEMREPVVKGLIAASMAGTKDAFADLLQEVRRARISRSGMWSSPASRAKAAEIRADWL